MEERIGSPCNPACMEAVHSQKATEEESSETASASRLDSQRASS